MSFPTVPTPTYELILPSNNQKIKFRPFLVAEEKILIIALETQDADEITRAVKQVLKNCVLTKNVKIDNLPIFDIEYLFLNIRAKSIDEKIDLVVTCGDDGTTQVPISVFVDEIKVLKPEEHTSDIKLENGYSLKMKYPSIEQFVENNFAIQTKSSENLEKSFKLIASCIDSVYNEEDCWSGADTTEKDKIDFIEKLIPKDYRKIETFFNTMPKLSHSVTVVNPNTEKENTVVLEGLVDFFA